MTDDHDENQVILLPDFSRIFNFNQIQQRSPYGNTTLHVYRHSRPHEIVEFISTEHAWRSISYASPIDRQWKINEIRRLYEENVELFSSSDETVDPSYIDWSMESEILLKKQRDFLEQIDFYRTYNNRHPQMTKSMIEIIDYYLNEYLLFYEQDFPREQIKQTQQCFQQAIDEQNYLKYFIEAYTLTNNFHRILNKHLALYILDYFNSTSSSSMTNYRLTNCLVHIVTLIVHHPDREKYQFKGITYRGMQIRRNELDKYQMGNSILNRSFVSTSRDRSIAQWFAGNSSSNDEISVIFKYNIKRNRTAINVEYFSSVRDEKEILILPFGVFKVIDRLENDPQMSPPVAYEIELEECCEDDEQVIIQRQSSTSAHQRTMKTKQYSFWKYLMVIILVLLLSIVGIYIFKDKINFYPVETPSTKNCPPINNRSIWKARPAKQVSHLPKPVRYVAILHTTDNQCPTVDLCIPNLQAWQREHMLNGWDDIGYNFLISTNGDIFQGRGWDYVGAHCYEFNTKSIGIALIGDYVSVEMSRPLLDAAQSLIDCGIAYGYIRKDYQIVGHWSHGISESYLSYFDSSNRPKNYCHPKNESLPSS